MTVPNPPAWAQSVDAFSSAVNNSPAVSTAAQIQFPQTAQLGGLCDGLVGSTSMGSGLLAGGIIGGNTDGGTAGQVVSGGQGFADTICSLLGGPGAGAPNTTTPQAITTGGQNVSDAINGNPMASGTIAMGPGAPSGNVALDGINGTIAFANEMFTILQDCGCAGSNAPPVATPSSVISTASDTAAAVNTNPMASGLIAMGQDPSGSGNVAVDAINGVMSFANSLYSILQVCGCLPANAPPVATPTQVINTATDTAAAVHANKFAANLLGGGSGNVVNDAIGAGQNLTDSVHTVLSGAVTTTNNSLQDVVAVGGKAVNQNTANHLGHQSSTPAQSVNVANQNLLVSEDFANSYSVTADPTGHWSWDGTTGDPSTNTLGCLKCVADGTQPDYISNEIPVVAGENIETSATVEWDGLSYTGASPLIIGVEKFRQMNTADGSTVFEDIGGFDTASVASPGASSAGKFVGIAGTYLVEPGVDQIRLKKKVAPNGVGNVRFDNASFLKLDLISADAVPGAATVDSIVTNLYGAQGSGFTQNQAATALANNAASLASVSSKVASLEAEGHTGAVAGDDFNYSNELIASGNWGGGYTASQTTYPMGTYQADGLDASFVETGEIWKAGTIDCHFLWAGTDSVSTTDYQLVQVTLSSPPGFATVLGGSEVAYGYVLGRISSDFLNYIKLKIGGDGTYQVIRCVSGAETVMDSGTCSVPGSGALVSLYCGNKTTSATRNFMAQIGSMTISSFTESGTSSQVGSSYRGWGFGGFYNKYKAASGRSVLPPSVDQWLALDQ